MQTTTAVSAVHAPRRARPRDELRRRMVYVPCVLCRTPVDLADVAGGGRGLALCGDHTLTHRGDAVLKW